MRILITAGSTEVPIDRVRAISNIFRGKTGWNLAQEFASRGADVTLLASTSHGDLIPKINYRSFRTFDELHHLMQEEVKHGGHDAIIHSAAVSDYKVSSVLVKKKNLFGEKLIPIDASKKVSSSHPQLYLELSPTIKLIDQIREPWGFRGKLVKFKLQVGITDEELLTIAKKSVLDSQANYIVANCLEWYGKKAYIVGSDGSYESVQRSDLAVSLYQRLT